MNKPTDAIIDAVAPAHDVEGLPISDARSLRNVAHAEQHDTLRLPRGGPYDITLVAAKKFYDGSAGGEAGHYALVFVEFRAAGSRWRTAGLKVRAAEAKRIARDMLKGKPSKPGRGEPPRVGGKELARDDSELRGAQIGAEYVLYVRHRKGEAWARTLGVTIRDAEKPIVAEFLGQLVTKDV